MYLPSPASHARLPSRASRTLPYPCPLKSPLRRQMPLALVALSASIPPPYPCTRALVFAHPACPHMPTRTPTCPHARIRACIPVHPVTPAPRRTAPSPLSSGAQCEGATGTGSLLWLFLRWRRRLRLERPRATGAGHTSAQQAVARPRDHFTPKWGRRDPLYTEMGKT